MHSRIARCTERWVWGKSELRLLATMILVMALPLSIGCYDITSSDKAITRQLVADLEVNASSDTGATARAILNVGGDTRVYLTGTDRLVASAGETSKDMDSDPFCFCDEYTADFSTAAAGTAFTIAFLRSGGEFQPAPNSTGTLPAPFVLNPIAAFSRAHDDVPLTWTPSGSTDLMRVRATSIECAISFTKDLPGDSGSYTLPKGTLRSGNDMKQESCTVQVELSRRRNGSIDGHFARGGRFELYQSRTATIPSLP